jgi:hypothetical protein
MPTLSRPRQTVRPTSAPFTPRSLQGLSLWLAADAVTGLSNLSPVGSWPDQSGLGNHATQASGSRQPLFIASAVNGRPALRFDATDDGMTTPLILAAPYTLLVIYSYRGTLSANRRAVRGATNNWMLGPLSGMYHCYPGTFVPDAEPVVQNQFILSAAVQTAGACTHYFNGVAKGPVVPTTVIGQVALGYTTSDPLDGEIAEVLAYDRALPTAERQKAEAYLRARYGI